METEMENASDLWNFSSTNFTLQRNDSSSNLALQSGLAVTLTLITLATTLSNAFVIATIYQSRKLHTPANVLIASLAVTDLLVSILVMPISALYTVSASWTLGQAVCDIWLSSDITCCTASILHLCIIALDRYWAITDAVDYSKKRTMGRAAGMIATAWPGSESSSSRAKTKPGKRLTSAHLITDSPGSVASSTSLNYGTNDASSCDTSVNQVKVTVSDALLEKKRISAARERKATKTLGIILGAYIVCWLPFFIYTLVVSACDSCFHPGLFDIFTWLGYLNSLINPIIYTMSNEDFKRAFHKLIGSDAAG
ncbi:hypothetical protein F7725_020039, partial [Dissostichus mawsoni]